MVHFLRSLPIALLPFFSSWGQDRAQIYEVKKIFLLNISSSINPATLSYLESGFETGGQQGANLFVITMDTPGGLVSTTKKIITLMGQSPSPVVVWVSPEGASATSAGAIIANGAHLLFMAPGTNIGAATPITLTEGSNALSKEKKQQDDGKKKAINDLSALMSSLAKARGRGQEAFIKMVSQAQSYDAQQALEKRIHNGFVNTQEELIRTLDGRKITLKGREIILKLPSSPEVVPFAMDLGQKLLNVLANPSVAYILFLMGVGLLYLELQAPGGLVPGAVGAFSLLLAGVGFQLLPLNFGAAGLVILAFILFLLESFVPSFGLLSLLGLTSLTVGGLFFYRTDDSYLEMGRAVVYSGLVATAIIVALVGAFLARNYKKGPPSGKTLNWEGEKGVIVSCLGKGHDGRHLYQVKARGALWKATSSSAFEQGEPFRVLRRDQDDLKLNIEKFKKGDSKC